MKIFLTLLTALVIATPLAAAEPTPYWKTQTVTGTVQFADGGFGLVGAGLLKTYHHVAFDQVAVGGEYVNLTWTAPVVSDLDIYFIDGNGDYMDGGCFTTNIEGAPADEAGLGVYSNVSEERCFAPEGAAAAEVSFFTGARASFTFTYAYLTTA